MKVRSLFTLVSHGMRVNYPEVDDVYHVHAYIVVTRLVVVFLF